MRHRSLVICLLLFIAFQSCFDSQSRHRVIVIQPFSDFPSELFQSVYRQVKLINPNTVLWSSVPLPQTAYYPLRARYRADKLIAYLKTTVADNDTVVIGLTGKDISTTKGDVADWGVMGLAYEPGRACIVSSFRLNRQRLASQFYKVVVHELGHTQGLPHCPDPSCYMRNAEGGNPTDEEHDFCPSCKAYLKSKGWRLN